MLTIAPPAAPPVLPVPPARTGETGACRVRLTPGPIAAAQARHQVRLALTAWNVPVDADIAVLLTSDLVTYAIWNAPGGAVTLGVRCTRTQLTIDVHDSASPSQPSPSQPSPSQPSPSLALVARLSADWGSAQTPAGRAAYFTLAFASHG